MFCEIPTRMCFECLSKYESLENTPLAHKRSPGPNVYQVIFNRYLFNFSSFSLLDKMVMKFTTHVKELCGLEIDPVMHGIQYGPGGAENGASMYVSMLVGFPRPLLFLDENPKVVGEILDDLLGGLPKQPVGTTWEVVQVGRGGHHALMRLGWLERIVQLSIEFPTRGADVTTWTGGEKEVDV
ncbi:hypothetical protein BJX63DRAFT_436275 [Aspergillus granulosus]|uniref:Uncharacterized protein n=1 Tax=Aspergillus granulosus TaxID=176169 RepID=A0ABR4GZ83_9EURO